MQTRSTDKPTNEFLLTEEFIGGSSTPISEEEYTELLSSKNLLKKLWDAEATFSLLATSYLEFEEELISLALNYALASGWEQNGEQFFTQAHRVINLKLVSFLTASRVYEEQLSRIASSISEISEYNVEVKDSFAREFDGNLEYRVMYALRNYALHHELPLGTISFSGSNLSSTGDLRDGSPTRHRTTVNPAISIKKFVSSDKVRAKTREEVEQLGCEFLDLKFFVRGYVGAFARVHDDFRKISDEILVNSLNRLRDAKSALAKIKRGEPKHISVIVRSDGQKVDSQYIDYDKNSRLSESRKHWSGLKAAQRVYVSSELVDAKHTYPDQHERIWIPK